MSATAFPTTFPAEAAKKIGQAILARHFTKDLIEPLYDLIGYGLFSLGLGSLPSPTPEPPTPADDAKKAFSLDDLHGMECEADTEAVGRYLLAASDSHAFGAAPNAKVLPWGTIMGALLTILQGLILAFGDSPIPKPQPPAE